MDDATLDGESAMGAAKEWNYTVSMAEPYEDDDNDGRNNSLTGVAASVTAELEMPDMQQNHERMCTAIRTHAQTQTQTLFDIRVRSPLSQLSRNSFKSTTK